MEPQNGNFHLPSLKPTARPGKYMVVCFLVRSGAILVFGRVDSQALSLIGSVDTSFVRSHF